MKTILLLLGHGYDHRELRQTPAGDGVVENGHYRIVVNQPISNPDFVVVRDKAAFTPTTYRISPSHVVLVTGEPHTITTYPKGYCRQFYKVYSCQKEIKGNGVMVPPMIPWFVGCPHGQDYEDPMYKMMSFSDLEKAKPKKTKLISVVSSDKAFTAGHIQRLRFVRKLKERYGDQVDIFGRGIRDFTDKWEVLAPYRYHIAIENCAQPYYLTEKLLDCYLTSTYPIYYGAPNADKFVPATAFTSIDIYDLESAFTVIDRVIRNDTYGKNLTALEEAKRVTLHQMNMLERIAAICDSLPADEHRVDVKLRPAKEFFSMRNLYLQNLSYAFYKAKWNLERRFR